MDAVTISMIKELLAAGVPIMTELAKDMGMTAEELHRCDKEASITITEHDVAKTIARYVQDCVINAYRHRG